MWLLPLEQTVNHLADDQDLKTHILSLTAPELIVELLSDPERINRDLSSKTSRFHGVCRFDDDRWKAAVMLLTGYNEQQIFFDEELAARWRDIIAMADDAERRDKRHRRARNRLYNDFKPLILAPADAIVVPGGGGPVYVGALV